MFLFLILCLLITGQSGWAEMVKNAGGQVESLSMTTAEPLIATQPNTNSAGGISCYVCNSHNDTACSDEKTLRKEHIQKCEPFKGQNSVGCWRLQQWVNYDENAELRAHDRIIRKCAYRKQDHQCIYKSGFGAMVSHCLCNTTACNGALNISQNAFFVLLPTILCFIVMKFST